MPKTCPTCGGSRRVGRAIDRSWWQTLFLRPTTVEELCTQCGGIGVVKGSTDEEQAFERERQRKLEELERKTLAGRVSAQEQHGRNAADGSSGGVPGVSRVNPGSPPIGSGDRTSVTCPGCGQVYRLGVDAFVITTEGFGSDFAFQIGSGDARRNSPDDPDGIAKLGPEPRSDVHKHLPSLQRALSAGRTRYWRCWQCKKVSPYSGTVCGG